MLDISMVPVADFLPQVKRLSMVIDQSIVDDMLLYDIGRAVAETLSRTKILTETDSIELQQCVNDYPVPCQPGLKVNLMSTVDINGRPLAASASAFGHQHGAPHVGAERFYWEPATQVIHLQRRNACGQVDADAPAQLLTMRMVLTTSPDACEVPAVVFEREDLREAVLAGACYRLCDVHQPPRAGYWHNRFEDAIVKLIGYRVQNFASTTPQQMRTVSTNFISR